MTPFSEKLRRARTLRGITQNGLDDMCNWQHGRTNAYERRGLKPRRLADLERLAEVLGVTVSWLTDGRDTLPGPGEPPSPFATRNPHGMGEMVLQAGRWWFPVLGQAAAAAAPIRSEGPPDPDDFESFSDDLYAPDRFVIVVRGDSMVPRIPDGSRVLIAPSTRPIPGLFWAAELSEDSEPGYLIKVLQRGAEGQLRLCSLAGPDPEIPLGATVKLVGYLVGIKQFRGRRGYNEEGDPEGIRV